MTDINIVFYNIREDYSGDTKESDNNEINVHKGFYLALKKILPDLLTFMADKNPENKKKIWFSGHSLGGALSVLIACMLALDPTKQETVKQIGGIYTFGQPKVGDKKFAEFMEERFGDKIFRIVLGHDPITMLPLPPIGFGYRHVGKVVLLYKNGEIKYTKNGIKIFKYQAYGLINYFSIQFLKLIIEKITGFRYRYDNVMEYHNKSNYIFSLKMTKNLEFEGLIDLEK